MNTLIKKVFSLTTLLFIISINLFAVESKSDSVETYKFDTLANVPTTTVKNQFKSGTCWSFAATSFLETEILRIAGKEVDIAEMYFVYYAFQAKASSYVRLHGIANFSPGGQAHDVMDVVREKGFVLEKSYPAYIGGFDNHVHGELDNVLKGFLQNVVKNPSGQLSSVWSVGFNSLLNSYLGDATMLNDTAKDNKKVYGINPDDYIEITSYKYKPYYKPIRLEVPDNWSFDKYYNIPLDEMMNLIQSALKRGYSVCWDGDVSSTGFSFKNALAILPETKVENMAGSEQSKWENMDKKELMKNMYSFDKIVPEKVVTEQMRQEAFDNYVVTDDHLMHLTALLKDQKGTLYYVTKNSWAGNSNKNGGYLNMSESYMRMNTVAIMVHKDALPKALKKKLGL